MSTKEYIVKREDEKWFFELHVSTTLEAMHAHLQEFFKDIGGTPHEGDTLGLLHPMARQIYDGKDWVDVGVYAVMFLNDERLNHEIVAHECVHAALAYERYCNGKPSPAYGEEIGEDEERLAYLIGSHTAGVLETLAENGHKVAPR